MVRVMRAARVRASHVQPGSEAGDQQGAQEEVPVCREEQKLGQVRLLLCHCVWYFTRPPYSCSCGTRCGRRCTQPRRPTTKTRPSLRAAVACRQRPRGSSGTASTTPTCEHVLTTALDGPCGMCSQTHVAQQMWVAWHNGTLILTARGTVTVRAIVQDLRFLSRQMPWLPYFPGWLVPLYTACSVIMAGSVALRLNLRRSYAHGHPGQRAGADRGRCRWQPQQAAAGHRRGGARGRDPQVCAGHGTQPGRGRCAARYGMLTCDGVNTPHAVAMWAAINFPLADVRVVTFGAPRYG